MVLGSKVVDIARDAGMVSVSPECNIVHESCTAHLTLAVPSGVMKSGGNHWYLRDQRLSG